MNWREDVLSIVESRVYDKLHILTHPFWYNEIELSMKDILERFLSRKLGQNIRALEEIISVQPKDLRFIKLT
jgi:hypothetical protein